jgi:hypothetical protein
MMTQTLFDRSGGAVHHMTQNEFEPVPPMPPMIEMMEMTEMMPMTPMMNEKSMCNPELGICSVPIQEWERLYDEDKAFSAGTIFPCLDKPFLGGGR